LLIRASQARRRNPPLFFAYTRPAKEKDYLIGRNRKLAGNGFEEIRLQATSGNATRQPSGQVELVNLRLPQKWSRPAHSLIHNHSCDTVSIFLFFRRVDPVGTLVHGKIVNFPLNRRTE
jgi:hypothetical protein